MWERDLKEEFGRRVFKKLPTVYFNWQTINRFFTKFMRERRW